MRQGSQPVSNPTLSALKPAFQASLVTWVIRVAWLPTLPGQPGYPGDQAGLVTYLTSPTWLSHQARLVSQPGPVSMPPCFECSFLKRQDFGIPFDIYWDFHSQIEMFCPQKPDDILPSTLIARWLKAIIKRDKGYFLIIPCRKRSFLLGNKNKRTNTWSHKGQASPG